MTDPDSDGKHPSRYAKQRSLPSQKWATALRGLALSERNGYAFPCGGIATTSAAKEETTRWSQLWFKKSHTRSRIIQSGKSAPHVAEHDWDDRDVTIGPPGLRKRHKLT
jgi:hypothetical protein